MAQSQQLGDLVEGFAQRIIYRGAPAFVIADAAHQHELAMPARYQQHQIGKCHAIGHAGSQRMGFKMIDGQQRLVERGSEGLGGGQAHQHAPDQAGASRGCDRINIGQRDIGLATGLGDDMVEIGDMGTRGQLWYHAAECRMFIELTSDHIGTNR